MDRDRATCEAMAAALETDEEFEISGFALTPDQVQERVEDDEVHFVIASASLPSRHLMEVCRWFRREFTGEFPHVVITGMPKDPAMAIRFVENGSPAFTMEDFSLQGLRLTLRLLARGEALFSPKLQHLMSLRLSELAEMGRDRGLDLDAITKLTPREREVLDLLDQRLTNREIGKKLFIVEGTVKSHVHQILKKLNVRHRKEAVRLLRLRRTTDGEPFARPRV
jgi:RNA polymerase sigma factor (sigma-70 family)